MLCMNIINSGFVWEEFYNYRFNKFYSKLQGVCDLVRTFVIQPSYRFWEDIDLHGEKWLAYISMSDRSRSSSRSISHGVLPGKITTPMCHMRNTNQGSFSRWFKLPDKQHWIFRPYIIHETTTTTYSEKYVYW